MKIWPYLFWASRVSFFNVRPSSYMVFNSRPSSGLGQSPRPAMICASTRFTLVSNWILVLVIFCLGTCDQWDVSWLKILLKPKYCLLKGRNNCVRKAYFQIASPKWIFCLPWWIITPEIHGFSSDKPLCVCAIVSLWLTQTTAFPLLREGDFLGKSDSFHFLVLFKLFLS